MAGGAESVRGVRRTGRVYAPAWAGLARAHRMLGKYFVESHEAHFREAEIAVRKALELNPDLSYAENLYAHIEVDLGRAEEAMVRLLRRAGDRRSDPLLFAGLAHACRYCGLLQASVAAWEHAVRSTRKCRRASPTRTSCAAITPRRSSTARSRSRTQAISLS